MLTADLLRVRDDSKKKTISPRYLDMTSGDKKRDKYVARAEGLVEIFAANEGKTHGELHEAIGDFVGDGTDYLITRGLTKLLLDRATFELAVNVDPQWLRARLFALSAEHHPIVRDPDVVHAMDRDAFLEHAAEVLTGELAEMAEADDDVEAVDLTPERIEAALYADLEENQILTDWQHFEAETLIHRYNLALAQAILYRATVLNVRLLGGTPKQHRQLFRFMKFCRLMHSVRKRAGGVWDIVIDGPLSLFSSTQKYGLQMAIFLPALLLVDDWHMEAELAWGPRRDHRTFTLDPSDGLVSHYKRKGQYITEEQEYFEQRFNSLDSPWTLSRDTELIDLGGKDICVPDLVFRHDDDGRVALLEIVGFWRKGWLKSKAALLDQHGPDNLILAVSDRMKTDKGKKVLESSRVNIFPFKGVILHRRVLELVEEVAAVP